MKSLAAMRLGPVAEFELRHWLGTLRSDDVDGSVLALFRRACLARNGGPRVYHVCGSRWPGPLPFTQAPDWIVRVRGEDATLQCLPFGQAWQLDLSELLALLLEWFDAAAPRLAARMRSVNGEEMRRSERSPTLAASIAAVAAISVPSLPAVESALGVALPLVRSSEGKQEHHAEFERSHFASANFFLNRESNAAAVMVTPHITSPEELNVRELGWAASFDGFNFERPGEARRQFRASFPGRELHAIEPARAEPALVMVRWLPVRRAAPLRRCAAPPAGISRLVDFAALKTPTRTWLTMRFDGEDWIPDPTIKLPAGVALRVELQNLAAFPGVTEHRRERLCFFVDASSRESRRVAGSDQLRETLFAQVIEVCVAGDDV